MAGRIKIEGLEDCLRCMDQAPGNLLKMSRTAAREAAKATTKHIKGGIPKRWKSLANSKVKKTRDGRITATMGLYNKKGGRGATIPDWFKAYWANYGTLAHRDPTHTFQYPVKRRTTTAAKNRKNKGGQRAQRFFEGAVRGWEDVFVRAFEESLKKQEDKLTER